MEKPLALSEVIMWARTLQMCNVKRLDKNVVEATVSELAKREKDVDRLLAATNRILKIIDRRYYQNRNILAFPKQQEVITTQLNKHQLKKA